MADPGIKKVIIAKKNLPSIFGTHQKYVVRYRIVSEDRNRTSHWSAQYKLNAPAITNINHSISVDATANTIKLVWDEVSNISGYDIYVKWDSGSWSHITTTTNNNYTCLIKDSSTSVQFAVQVPTFPKSRFVQSTLFETVSTSL
jgi:hypothetical protein